MFFSEPPQKNSDAAREEKKEAEKSEDPDEMPQIFVEHPMGSIDRGEAEVWQNKNKSLIKTIKEGVDKALKRLTKESLDRGDGETSDEIDPLDAAHERRVRAPQAREKWVAKLSPDREAVRRMVEAILSGRSLCVISGGSLCPVNVTDKFIEEARHMRDVCMAEREALKGSPANDRIQTLVTERLTQDIGGVIEQMPKNGVI